MSFSIKILDSTLRDGGLGLEDAVKNNISDLTFSSDDILKITDCLCLSDIDIVELGSIERSTDDKRGFAIYQCVEDISGCIPNPPNSKQMYVGLFRGPDTPVEEIPEYKEGYCQGLRVIIRYSELQKSLDFCKALSEKGYKVFVQPMLTMRYTDGEIDKIINASNDMNAYALYFVDSYGYMGEADVTALFNKYNSKLNKDIKIGFHAHNNMNLAFSNVLSFIKNDNERDIIIDSCIMGMGQGSGNMQTEIITNYINEAYGCRYNFDYILDACEIVGKYNADSLWGYSVTRFLPAIHKTAYKYALSLRNKYKLTYRDIDRVLKNIPEELRHRYTPENTIELLRLNGIEL